MPEAPRKLRFPFRCLNFAADRLAHKGVRIAGLDEKALLSAAQKKTGLLDFGDDSFREGLRILLDSLRDDAVLHFVGSLVLRQTVVRFLVNRLLIENARKSPPRPPLIPPIVVTGMPRSGTTLLHRLLAQDPCHRALPLWEMLQPVPRKQPDRRLQKAQGEILIKNLLLPGLDMIHYTRADTPEECIVLLACSFSSPLYWRLAPVYGYLSWFRRKEPLQPYREYESLLRLLQSRDPERRLVLKAPDHLGSLETLKTVMPEAMIIQTHRDPGRCIGSICSLQKTMYGLVTDHVDAKRLGETNLDFLEESVNRSLAFHEANPAEVFHVSYEKLKTEETRAARSIYEHFNLPWSRDNDVLFERYASRHPQHEFGVHRYGLQDYGLDEGDVQTRFRAYRARFGTYLS
jgi:hypothetical protein